MENFERRVNNLISEAQHVSQDRVVHPLLYGAIELLQELRDELAKGALTPERRKSYAYGIYRTVIDDNVFAETEIGQKLMKLSDELAGQ